MTLMGITMLAGLQKPPKEGRQVTDRSRGLTLDQINISRASRVKRYPVEGLLSSPQV